MQYLVHCVMKEADLLVKSLKSPSNFILGELFMTEINGI